MFQQAEKHEGFQDDQGVRELVTGGKAPRRGEGCRRFLKETSFPWDIGLRI